VVFVSPVSEQIVDHVSLVDSKGLTPGVQVSAFAQWYHLVGKSFYILVWFSA
jgi:hypothetical protein